MNKTFASSATETPTINPAHPVRDGFLFISNKTGWKVKPSYWILLIVAFCMIIFNKGMNIGIAIDVFLVVSALLSKRQYRHDVMDAQHAEQSAILRDLARSNR